ncbi:MAG: hypothetical protein EBR82_75910 [Caulobacteraceae bacterium]|nr:hypothetical protein [Caulobacteraceae bacterium]
MFAKIITKVGVKHSEKQINRNSEKELNRSINASITFLCKKYGCLTNVSIRDIEAMGNKADFIVKRSAGLPIIFTVEKYEK